MIRKVLTLIGLAVVALIVLKVAFALLGLAFGLAVTILVLAAFGYGFYLVLLFLSPKTAARIRELIRGTPTPTR